MAKTSRTKSASKAVSKVARAGTKKVTSVAGEALGAAAAAATGVILRGFAEALASNKNTGTDSATRKGTVEPNKPRKAKKKSATGAIKRPRKVTKASPKKKSKKSSRKRRARS